jgi:glycosyltransferase involved in cell wall biosynthesis
MNLQRLIGSTEFNLVPLQDNPFTNCKSELKFFEAAITGTMTLASPTHVFRAAIKDGKNGYLVNNTDWEQRIAEAVESRDRYDEIAEESVRYATTHYTGSVIRDSICQALFND